ncbi:MAG: WD40 repeat domain-containing protein [Pleurocapsa sp.]
MFNLSACKYLTVIALTSCLVFVEIAWEINLKAVAQTENNLPNSDFKSPVAAQQANFTQVAILQGHIQDISLLSFSPDGLIASVEPDGIIIWQDGKVQRILPGHYASESQMSIAPTAIAFSPDSRYLATATWSQGVLIPDKAIVVWEIATGKPVLTLNGDAGCQQLLFDPEGKIIYSTCGMGIQAWNFPSGEPLFSFDTSNPQGAIALTPDGKVMATVNANLTGGQQGEQSNIIQLWQLNEGEATLLNSLAGHSNDIAKLEFTANGRNLVSSSYDGKIQVWDWQKGTTHPSVKDLYSHNGIFSLSGDSRLIAGNFGDFSLADFNTGLPLTNSALFPQTTSNTMAFSSSNLLAWAGKPPQFPNPIISLWEETENKELVTTANLIATPRKNYNPLPLAKYWGKNEPVATDSQPSSDLKSPVGTNIKQMALDVFGLRETVENERQEVEISDGISPTKVVTITQTNLADDSVQAIRYRLEFAPYGDTDRGQWRIIWAGQQFQCQRDRGHQQWSGELCH